MYNLKDLSTLWQNHLTQEPPHFKFNLEDTSIIGKLKKLEKKQLRINYAKTIALCISLSFLTYIAITKTEMSLLIIIALIWIITTITVGMVFYWKKQFNLSDLEFSEDSKTFISRSIKKLNNQKRVMMHFLMLTGSALIIGVNLMYLDLLQFEEPSIRLKYHIGVSLFLLFVIRIGAKVRKRRFNKDFKPIIEELENIEKKLKNNISEDNE